MTHAELNGETQFNALIISAHLSMSERNVSLRLIEIAKPKNLTFGGLHEINVAKRRK